MEALEVVFVLLLCTGLTSGQNVARKTEVILGRLNSSDLTRRLLDFYPYQYDDYSLPMYRIRSGGDNIFGNWWHPNGNEVRFKVTGDVERNMAAYNHTYNGSDYSFSTLAIHPFTGFFYINSTTSRRYTINVYSTLGGNSRSLLDFAGSVKYGEYILSYGGVQVFDGLTPSVCQVYFYVAKNQSGIDFVSWLPSANLPYLTSEAYLDGIAEDVVFGYTLLSTFDPGREITQTQLDDTMMDMLVTVTKGFETNSSTYLRIPNPKLARETEVLLNRIKMLNLTKDLPDFYRYIYDDASPVNKMNNGGDNMYYQGNWIQFGINNETSFAEYNKTYSGDDYTFSTLATHPFIALFYINSTAPKYRNFTIEVSTNNGGGRFDHFSGLVSNKYNTITFEGVQNFERYAPTVCEVFFYIAQNQSNQTVVLNIKAGTEWWQLNRNEAILNGYIKDALFGYILLSTHAPGRKITQLQLERTMLGVLDTLTGYETAATSLITDKTSKTQLIMQSIISSNLTKHIQDFHRYVYDDRISPMTKIQYGGDNMYNDGNNVLFGVNNELIYAEYNRTYSGLDYSFTTMAIHPFVAFFYINATANTNRSYTIELLSRGSAGVIQEFSGSVSLGDYVLTFKGSQNFGSFTPSACEVFFVIDQSIQHSFTFAAPHTGGIRRSTATVRGNPRNIVFGYTLLSTIKPGRDITLKQIEKTMFDMLATITANNETAVPSYIEIENASADIQQIIHRLENANLTRHVKDFYRYRYDDTTFPINGIANGGDNMYYQGNYVSFVAENGLLTSYNQTYRGSGYSFSTVAIHPYVAFFHINSTDQSNQTYTIKVWSNPQSNRQISTFGGSVKRGKEILTFEVYQFFSEFVPSEENELHFQLLYQNHYYHRYREALLQGNITNALFGYTLLSTVVPGREVTPNQVADIMLDVLITMTSNETLPPIESQDADIYRQTTQVLDRLKSSNITINLKDFYRYRYDDYENPINHISNGGNNLYNYGGNYVKSRPYYYHGSFYTFDGIVSNHDYVLHYKGHQDFNRKAPSLCEVYYYISKNITENEFTFEWSSQNYYYYYGSIEAHLYGNISNTFFGYMLLSTFDPGREISHLQLESTMLKLLSTLTEDDTSSPNQTQRAIVANQTEILIDRLKSSNLTTNITDFYRYTYDDRQYPINKIQDGGYNMYDDGNYIYFSVDGDTAIAEYNQSYICSNYSFSTLAMYPFTAFFYIDHTDAMNGSYSIEVRSVLGYYWSAAYTEFVGAVTNGKHFLTFRAAQAFERYNPSTCEVFFYITENQTGKTFNVSTTNPRYRNRRTKGVLEGNVENVVFGYTLLSTLDRNNRPREITQTEMETTMEYFLNAITGYEVNEENEALTTVEGFPGTNVILLRIFNKNVTTATRTYSVQVNGGGDSQATIVHDVKTTFIEDLTPLTFYTITVSVLNDGLLQSTIHLTVKTVQICTLQCTNGKCIVFGSSRTECVCNPSYQPHQNLTNVCVDINECQQTPSPCPADALCSNTDGSFTCKCRRGLQLFGEQCVDPHICERDPCNNNGDCISNRGTFSCNCTKYYYGTRCEYYTSPCLNVPCQNGGTCIDLSGSYECTCTTSHTGPNCDLDADECQLDTHHCDPNSKCENTVGSFKCICNEGYRGNGRKKCYRIRLLPYGENEQDQMLEIEDDVASPTIRASYAIPFGTKRFRDMRVTSNGFISLGSGAWFVQYLIRPFYNGFNFFDVAVIAPFWDDFHPNINNNGRVYYQVYDKGSETLTNKSEVVVHQIANRINHYYERDDFEPLFVLKVTWSEVVIFDEYYNRKYPSTFQAIVASDGTDTYLIYNYKEDAMLWDTRKRYYWGNRALIGYNFGLGQDYIEVQGNYRPDHRNQTAGGPIGQYYYQVASGVTDAQKAAATTGCLKWVLRELNDPWLPDFEPCPCNSLQARIDRRFTWSVDAELYLNSVFDQDRPGHYLTANVDEWTYDEVGLSNCYQPRFNRGPRCCYSPRTSSFSRFWGWLSLSPIISGPFSSRYERDQIPIFERNPSWSWVRHRDVELFYTQYNKSLENDLIPRRQCCVESNDEILCDLYQALRPPATCSGYIPRRISFFWGDPHITTNDEVTYSFNGLGEYHMLYAPGVFSMQARTKKAKKEDMTESDATVFTAFAAKDLATDTSGTVQFEVDFSSAIGDEVIVKVNGALVENITDTETVVEEVSLTAANGTYTATFPSSNSLSITSTNFLLTMQFTGDTATLQNYSQGLMGYWDGIKENDFLMRNGTTLDWMTLQPTENQDILNNTLNERSIFFFGQTWKLFNESESFFNYTGETGDTFQDHNPTLASEPPFLEDLVAEQRGFPHFEGIRANCTTNNVLSTTCLYDVLMTNRSEIGENTKAESESSSTITETNANSLPNVTISPSPYISVINGKNTLVTRISEEATFKIEATDSDGHNVTFRIAMENSISGPFLNNITGVFSWTPTSDHIIANTTNMTLTAIATDSLGGETIMRINVKLCHCLNNGTCVVDSPIVGNENYQIVDCNCTEAYTGSNCSEDRNGCLLSACFTNVTCTDVPAPGVGESCGDCPEGTTGDGRNCTNIDMCDLNPCEHMCESIYNGFICSCNDGYVLENTTQCRDVDECTSDPCTMVRYSHCVNTIGNYSCVCNNGFTSNTSEVCQNIDECTTGFHNCSLNSTSCQDLPGSFTCPCLPNFMRNATDGDETSCVDLDECEQGLHNCDNQTEICVNEAPLFSCMCKDGFKTENEICVDIEECSDTNLNTCDNNTSSCVETNGGYYCKCLAGYQTNNMTCIDIDECLNKTMYCPMKSICDNWEGGYNCSCRDGFEMNADGTCVDVDECLKNSSICPDELHCYNTEGAYNCSCLTGYHLLLNGTCADEDECHDSNPCPEGASCLNHVGGYSCFCPTGYLFLENGTCTDMDECENETVCPGEMICNNTHGSYTCLCPSGYHRAEDRTCIDIDECLNENTSPGDDVCPTGQLCVNVDGSYYCSCPAGYQMSEDGTCNNTNICFEHNCPAEYSCLEVDSNEVCRCQDVNGCLLNPRLTPVSVLQAGTDRIEVLIDSGTLYQEYEVRAVDGNGTIKSVISIGTVAVVRDLMPNTKYLISARVRKLKTLGYIFDRLNFSKPVPVTTDTIKLAMEVTLVGQNYTVELNNIDSPYSIALRRQYESEFTAGLKSVMGNVTTQFLNVSFIAFRNGSVVASARGSLNTNNAGFASADVDGSGLNASLFENLATIKSIPPSPTNLRVTNITTSSITFGFESVPGSLLYELELTCPGNRVIKIVSTTVITIDGLPSNEVCSGRVRTLAIVNGSNSRAFSDFSNSLVASTSPSVTPLGIASITINSLVVSIASISRATSYHVTAEGIIPVHAQPTSSSAINFTITGLSQATTYVFLVTVVTNDVLGMERNGTGRVTATTADFDECMETPSVCPQGATCNNTFGSFECMCGKGLHHNLTTNSCVGFCSMNLDYCKYGGTCFQDSSGLPVCKCASGYQGERCEKADTPDNSWKIAVGVVGGILLVVLIVAVVVVSYKRNQRSEKYRSV